MQRSSETDSPNKRRKFAPVVAEFVARRFEDLFQQGTNDSLIGGFLEDDKVALAAVGPITSVIHTLVRRSDDRKPHFTRADNVSIVAAIQNVDAFRNLLASRRGTFSYTTYTVGFINPIIDMDVQLFSDAMEGNTTITEILLPHNNITAPKMVILAKLLSNNHHIQSMDVSRNWITLLGFKRSTAGIEALVEAAIAHPSLTNLGLSFNKIGADHAKFIARLLRKETQLKRLDLSGNCLTNGCLDQISSALSNSVRSNKVLTMLDLHQNNFDHRGAAHLAKALRRNSTLRELNLGNNQISDKGAADLAAALPPSLTAISLNANNIGDAGATSLAVSLAKLQENLPINLQSIDLSSNIIGDIGAIALAEASNIAEIKLRGNRIDDDGIIAFANKFRHNSTVSAEFANNRFGIVGISALADMLYVNTTLKRLDISQCWIGDAGVAALTPALRRNQTLTELDLSINQIRSEGAAAIAAIITVNVGLEKLDLNTNSIGDFGMLRLAGPLSINGTLRRINLSANYIGDTGANALVPGLSRLEKLVISNRDISAGAKSALIRRFPGVIVQA